MIRLALSIVLTTSVLFLAPALCAQSLPDLFRAGQQQFKAGEYEKSQQTFARLAEESSKPGFEEDRGRLEPVLMFFRGANSAMLGHEELATSQFIDYLVFVPGATIDERAFPRPVLRAFQQARKEFETMSRQAAAGDLSTLWRKFVPSGTLPADETWGSSAVRYLMTDTEKSAWSSSADNAARSRLIEEFWSRRDPSPGTPENEFRNTMESRMLFADRVFSTEDVRGRDSDRGLIFTLLGPPSFVRGGNIGTDEDAMAVLRTQRQGMNLGAGHQSRGNDRPLGTELTQGRQETWYYRGGQKPANVPFSEVKFSFVTKQGYGVGVLEKDSQALIVIGRASLALMPQ